MGKKSKEKSLGRLKHKVRNPYLWSLVLMIVGVLISLYMYIPVWEDFLKLNERQLSVKPPYRSYVIAELLPKIFFQFISFRYLMVLIFGVVIWLSFKREFRNQNRKIFIALLYLSLIFLIPFVLSFLNNNNPFDRTFIVLVPIFTLIIALSTHLVIKYLEIFKIQKELVVTAVILYSLTTLYIGNNHVQKHLKKNIQTGVREQTLTYNYYLSDLFDPVGQMSDFKNRQGVNTELPIVSFDDVDMISLSYTANLNEVKYFKLNWEKVVDTAIKNNREVVNKVADYWSSSRQDSKGYQTWQLNMNAPLGRENIGRKALIQYLIQQKLITDKFYAVTGFPNKFKEELQRDFPNATAKPLFNKTSYNNFYEVSLASK